MGFFRYLRIVGAAGRVLILVVAFQSCKAKRAQEAASAESPVTGAPSAELNLLDDDDGADAFRMRSLTSAVMYGLKLIPEADLAIEKGQSQRITLAGGQGPSCEVSGKDGSWMNFYTADSYHVLSQEGEEQLSAPDFTVEVESERDQRLATIRCTGFQPDSGNGVLTLGNFADAIQASFRVELASD